MTTQNYGKLKIIPVNKTVVFYSPIEGEDVLVRTGTMGDGSCFFHSLLHAYSKDYPAMDKKQRTKFVRKLRASMAGKVNRENWEEMGGGIISKIPFQENVHEILKGFYGFIENSDRKVKGRSSRRVIRQIIKEDQDFENYELVIQLLPLKILETKILPKSYDQSADDKIEKTAKFLLDNVINYIESLDEIKNADQENVNYIKQLIMNFIITVLGEAEDSAFNNFVKGLENIKEEVDTYTIEFISDRFNRDIFFLDGNTRLPYNNCSTTTNIKNRRTIILIWIGENHYEVVGRLLPGNRIQREFSTDDPLVDKLKTCIMEPDKIAEKYPELLEPDEANLPMEVESSGDDSSSESDPYYDSSDHESRAGSV